MTDRPIRQLPGIGPKMADWLEAVDIRREGTLRELGAVDAYWRLKHRDPRSISLNALWCLHAALQGIPMRAVDATVKGRLRAALTAEGGTSAGTRSPSRGSVRDRRPSSREP
ncbi:TfoX/Sxy family DNA transformation protein [Kaistia adipata]|uniref:TfoX/Sxy family DNA transformation protein n=1 Tax=Kaistia adipata TaxID=166954 RepID=UPI0009FF482C|nr:TfoX/Sxy family DNA transformation protein [Kaistia adipata]